MSIREDKNLFQLILFAVAFSLTIGLTLACCYHTEHPNSHRLPAPIFGNIVFSTFFGAYLVERRFMTPL